MIAYRREFWRDEILQNTIPKLSAPKFGNNPLESIVEWLLNGDRIFLEQDRLRKVFHECTPDPSSAKSSSRNIVVSLTAEVMVEFWNFVIKELTFHECTCALKDRVNGTQLDLPNLTMISYSLPLIK